MHPNLSLSVHVFQAPLGISETHISSATSDLVFIDIGMSWHADVNVILAHTDVKVKTAGGFAGASPAESRCRLRIGTNGCRRRRWPCSLWVNLHRRECFLILLDIVAPCG